MLFLAGGCATPAYSARERGQSRQPVIHAEAASLPDTLDAGKKFLCLGSPIDHLPRSQAIIASGAIRRYLATSSSVGGEGGGIGV